PRGGEVELRFHRPELAAFAGQEGHLEGDVAVPGQEGAGAEQGRHQQEERGTVRRLHSALSVASSPLPGAASASASATAGGDSSGRNFGCTKTRETSTMATSRRKLRPSSTG